MDDVKHLILIGVKITDREIGKGAYGRVFEVEYNATTFAAKKLQSSLLESPDDFEYYNKFFISEVLLHSKLDHPNIVKMFGVYFPSESVLPVLVMELMECTVDSLLSKFNDFPKLSILQDVSRGVCYLHTLNPPVIHCDLFASNILLKGNFIAKICDFGKAKKMPYFSEGSNKAIGAVVFAPPETFQQEPLFGLPYDVFSFGCLVCQVISQQWPKPLDQLQTGSALSEVQRRQHYIDQIFDGPLKQLVVSCLENDPERRPAILQVYERITSIKEMG